MKIYFTAPLYQKEKYLPYYQSIIKRLENLGHKVIQDTLDSDVDKVLQQTNQDLERYYKLWYGYVRDMDLCVADISFPCTVNIGFEIASILNRGKPVIALYREGTDPKFVSPEFSQKMIKAEYTLDIVNEIVDWTLAEALQQLNRRFTFFISPEIETYLDKKTKTTKKSRSEIIRTLLEKEIKDETEESI